VTFTSELVVGGAPTSRSLILVTPDGQRTMNTFLGISTDLDHGEVDPELIKNSDIVYLEGYLFDRPEAKDAFRQAVSIAASAGRRVALTLSDSFCVKRHRQEFLDLIRSGIGILFANESEITALYETTSFDEALRHATADTELAVLTRSEKGSIIVSKGETIAIPIEPVEVVDTTGAGDMYAAGFLFALARGFDLEKAGRLGSFAAGEIIGHIGARPEARLSHLARMRNLVA
jgi:sugar/nucleoside kinase (ribokinase family)